VTQKTAAKFKDGAAAKASARRVSGRFPFKPLKAKVLGTLVQPKSQVVKDIEIIREGFPTSKVTILADKLGLTKQQLARSIGVDDRTLRNREKRHSPLTAFESERLLRIEKVFAEASRIFHSEERARNWMNRPAYGLGNIKPIDFLDTDIGTQEVLSLLSAIEYGDYF
jgi:putative toxin-antitoxin system antitoxin component (TIGR02293 family)